MNNCTIKGNTEMKKEDHGTYDFRFNKKNAIFAVTWKENNIVKVLSNYEGLEPIQKVTRWCKAEKKQVKVSQSHYFKL